MTNGSQVYLRLWHGRPDADCEMHDWGMTGPVIGPIDCVHVVYTSQIRLFLNGNEVAEFEFVDDMIKCGNILYGDWCVAHYTAEQLVALHTMLQHKIISPSQIEEDITCLNASSDEIVKFYANNKDNTVVVEFEEIKEEDVSAVLIAYDSELNKHTSYQINLNIHSVAKAMYEYLTTCHYGSPDEEIIKDAQGFIRNYLRTNSHVVPGEIFEWNEDLTFTVSYCNPVIPGELPFTLAETDQVLGSRDEESDTRTFKFSKDEIDAIIDSVNECTGKWAWTEVGIHQGYDPINANGDSVSVYDCSDEDYAREKKKFYYNILNVIRSQL